MSQLVLSGLRQVVRRSRGHQGRRPRCRRGRVRGVRRPVGLRQIHAAAHDRRTGGQSPRATSSSTARWSTTCRRPSAASPWCSSPMRSIRTCRCARTWRFALQHRQASPKAEIEARVGEAAEILQLEQLLEQPARAAVRRPAPARRHRPRHRARAQDLPVRRAALQSRRGAPRRDARRDRRCTSGSARP